MMRWYRNYINHLRPVGAISPQWSFGLSTSRAPLAEDHERRRTEGETDVQSRHAIVPLLHTTQEVPLHQRLWGGGRRRGGGGRETHQVVSHRNLHPPTHTCNFDGVRLYREKRVDGYGGNEVAPTASTFHLIDLATELSFVHE